MACGDQKALPRAAVLDPQLTATQPPKTAAATGIDAIAHAVETAVTIRRNETSVACSSEAWRRLERSFESAVANGSATEAVRPDMADRLDGDLRVGALGHCPDEIVPQRVDVSRRGEQRNGCESGEERESDFLHSWELTVR